MSNWKVTNVANIGSKDDLAQRVASAKHEAEWKGCGQKDGIEIWRIENFGVMSQFFFLFQLTIFKIKRWPKEKYGSFFSGDCYIVLHTKGHRKWDVFYWIGRESTVVELDDLLGTLPVQHRETEGHESPMFMSLFPKGVRTMTGGIASGFRHVAPKEYKPRLLWIKGKKYVRAMEVPCKAASLNKGDAFILDQGEKVLIWIPSGASPREKYKCAQVAQEIRNSRKGKLEEERLDEGGSEEFWKYLGGKPSKIKGEDEVQSDAEFDDAQGGKFPKSLWRLCDASGKMKFTKDHEVDKNSKLDKTKLDTMDVFIVDGGEEVIAWIGKKTSKDERKKAILYATNFLGMQKKPVWTRIVRVEEGREGKRFWELFN